MTVAARLISLSALVIAMGVTPAASAQTHRTIFTDSIPNAIPGFGPAAIYPATIAVSGIAGLPYHVSVRLNVSHESPGNLDFLLVAPSGEAVMLISALRGGGPFGAWNNTTITLDDCAPRAIHGVFFGSLPSGRYRPSVLPLNDRPVLPAPAPEGQYGTELARFNRGTGNGTWSLFVNDRKGGPPAGTVNSWSITIFDSPGPHLGSVEPVSCTAPDYDGDGRTDIAVYRPLTGEWFISNSGSSGALAQVSWGAPAATGLGDIQVPADYDGDGITDLAVYRQATGEWFIRNSFDGSLKHILSFGAAAATGLGDTPVPGDYDGGGLADVAIYRTTTGEWFIRSSEDFLGLTVTTVPWGFPGAGDTPARR